MAKLASKSEQKSLPLPAEVLLRLHDLMVLARVVEERLIALYKSGHGYFWLGGPGEEAFNVPLGLLINKGQGPAYDYLHFHYRQLATMLAMGEDYIGSLRLTKNSVNDPYTGGRNFIGHYSKREWNVFPVTSTLEVQYAMAPGTALMQKRHGGTGISVVTGGDAGTAEGDFASGLNWATRPGDHLPVLFIVTNNRWGISTPASQVQGAKSICARAEAFGIPTRTIDGNDPIASYECLQEAFAYVRENRSPFFVEAFVSRLYGHSSASGAGFVGNEPDCIVLFEQRLAEMGLLAPDRAKAIREKHAEEVAAVARKVREEPWPAAETLWNHLFYGEPGRDPFADD